MEKKEERRIDYVPPQVIELGFSEPISGQVYCGPGNTPDDPTLGCQTGLSNPGSCHTGRTASTTCDQGETPGGQCKSSGNGAPGGCRLNGNTAVGNCVNQGLDATGMPELF